MSTNHLDRESLIGYVNRTLDDAERESIENHLLDCPLCRGNLIEEELRQRWFAGELNAVIGSAAPSERMSFASVRPQLEGRRPKQSPWLRLAVSRPLAYALVGLLLSLIGVWKIIDAGALFASPQKLGAYPTIACFFFLLASVEGFDKAILIRPRFIIVALVSGILWLGTALIGLLNIQAIIELSIGVVVALGGNAAEATPIAMLAALVAAMFYIGLVIGGADYHLKNLGQPRSWKVFSITLLIQLLILILPYLV